jgi:hypothetical protein
MATFTVMLTPDVVTQVSEGNLDTSVVGGLSAQRTMEVVLVVNGEDRKQLHRLADGETYDDITFETVVPTVVAGNPNFPSGTPVISVANVTIGHPTASSNTGSTL